MFKGKDLAKQVEMIFSPITNTRRRIYEKIVGGYCYMCLLRSPQEGGCKIARKLASIMVKHGNGRSSTSISVAGGFSVVVKNNKVRH
jgi:hypothetical protein